jgi:hypothetical protein
MHILQQMKAGDLKLFIGPTIRKFENLKTAGKILAQNNIELLCYRHVDD